LVETMTELLQQVIAEIKKLPADQQDAIASRLMAELKDEQRWTEQFESTSDEQWEQLTDLVRQEIANGETVPLDEIFPVKS
jgi:preprotein translocase subunit SecA